MAKQQYKFSSVTALGSLASGFATVWASKILMLFGFFIFLDVIYGAGFRRTRVTLRTLAPNIWVILLFLGVVVFLLRVFSSACLCQSVRGKISGAPLSFADSIRKAAPRFLQMFFAHLAMYIPVILFVLIMGAIRLALVKFAGFSGGCFKILFLAVFFISGLIFAMALGAAFSWTQRRIVFFGDNFLAGWKNGVSFFWNNKALSMRLAFVQTLLMVVCFGAVLFAVSFIPKIPIIKIPLTALPLIFLIAFFGAGFHAMYTDAFCSMTKSCAEYEKAEE